MSLQKGVGLNAHASKRKLTGKPESPTSSPRMSGFSLMDQDARSTLHFFEDLVGWAIGVGWFILGCSSPVWDRWVIVGMGFVSGVIISFAILRWER